MPRILHAADLHLSETDRDYGLAVLAELMEAADREKADYLLFCGDLFNTFADAEKLRAEFRGILGSPRFEFLYLPGNHEDLQRGGGDLSRLDWGAATVLHARPFELLRRERAGCAVEFLAIPHQEDYSGYGNWQVPPRRAPWRVALAHGVVAGMSYRGPDEESGGGALDPDLFLRFRADYAALGHIHGRRSQTVGGTRFAYPGSTRVWRKKEMGPRGAYLLDLPGQGSADPSALPEPAFVALASAGEYRCYSLPLTLEGEVPDLEALARTWGPADYIELEFTGLVEDERAAAESLEGLRGRLASRVRTFAINRDGVSVLPGISSQPIVRKFLEAWSARMPAGSAAAATSAASENGENGAAEDAAGRAVWMRAREMALNSLKAGLEHIS